MRPLTDDEKRTVFEKLAKFIGANVKHLLVGKEGEDHVLRLHRARVYYMSRDVLNMSTNFSRKTLFSAGTMVGKFTKSGKFRLTIQILDILAKHSQHKIWLKTNSEMSFLYGNHIPKASVARMTEDTAQYDGVIVFNMNDVPLGFGVAAQPTEICKTLDPTALVVIHQGDVGEYLRNEIELN